MMQRGSDSARDLIDTARECYEAFVIYNFVLYLVAYFGSEHEIVTMLQQRKHAPEKMLHFWNQLVIKLVLIIQTFALQSKTQLLLGRVSYIRIFH